MAAIDDRLTLTKTSSKPITGADVLVESLVRHGVEVVFAYPGGASMPLHQALTRYRERIRTILPRHEQGGIFAAEGYARASGKAGVVMATLGGRIWATSDCRVIVPAADIEIAGTAFYADRYVKTDDGWRIAHTGYMRVFEEHRIHSTLAVHSFSSRFDA